MSDITYTRITPDGEEKCSLLEGDGMTREEKVEKISEFCEEDNRDCGDCIISEPCAKCLGAFDRQPDRCNEAYDILVNAGLIKPPVDFVKANPDDEVDSEVDAVESGLADSGTRREFASGAVRDVAEGKGRCDLLPLEVIGDMYNTELFWSIHSFVHSGDVGFLQNAIELFCNERKWDNPTMLLEVAKHFEAGCKKYGERNWEKGIPLHCYIDSGVRHYLKWLRGDTDEPHDRAFCWNMLCCIWTCNNLPEMNDLPWAKEAKK